MVAKFRGKLLHEMTADERHALLADAPAFVAEFDAMPLDDRREIMQAMQSVMRQAERKIFSTKLDIITAREMLDFAHDARQSGLIEGLKTAIATGSRSIEQAKFHAEARAPWSSFIGRFYASRPGLMGSTRASYAQAFKEWEALITDKDLADLTARDVSLYSEYLNSKVNNKGHTGALNRKTIIRLLGHVRTFTGWARSSGLITHDPGLDTGVREKTRAERLSDETGPKRAFTTPELAVIFDSPLFTGYYSDHYRSRSGNIHKRDAAWWFFACALLTGARVEELANAPASLVDLSGTACLDFRHGSKTVSAPRLVPVILDLSRLGFLDYASSQKSAGLKLFDGAGASDDWSKWTNNYLRKVVSGKSGITFHSFRHTFRQMCSAAQLGDYLADKLLGHRNKRDRSEGASYGRLLSPDEATLAAAKVRAPVALDHLYRTVTEH